MKVFTHWISPIFAGLMFSAPVFAYIGPGAGLSAIGSVLALLGAVLLMILGFVWYPVKRILVRRKQESLALETDVDYMEVDDADPASEASSSQSERS